MEIYLIRHTETVLEKGICYGQSDVTIREPYISQFNDIYDSVNNEYNVLYSSPLRRCIILAEFLNRNNKVPIKTDDRLMELNFGEWELKIWDEIDSEKLNEWGNDFVNISVPKGESFKQLFLRVTDFIKSELFLQSADKPIVIVTHSGVIRCFLCYFNDILLKDAFNISVSYGQVKKLNIDPAFIPKFLK